MTNEIIQEILIWLFIFVMLATLVIGCHYIDKHDDPL